MRTLILILLLLAGPAAAKNVDLVTLPGRDTIQLTIYNSADITLVKETRSVTLQRGANRLQFSWAGTLIDPTSVELRPLRHADRIEVADTVFPGQKPQHLIWNIVSEVAGEVPVEVSYFTSGLTWTMDYVVRTNPDETRMDLAGHVRVYNHSGEEYENAQVRLIVGKINLVERIAVLARRRGIPLPKAPSERYKALRKEATLGALKRAADKGMAADMDELVEEEKGIVKEGLSEYFLFTIDGTETIRNGWSKRMVAVRAEDTEFAIVYRMRAHQYGPRPVRFFSWKNDKQHNLGDSPLPDGRVRIFRRNANDGLSFLGEQQLRYAPISAKVEVNLGPDDLVVYETRRTGSERFRFRHEGKRERVTGWSEKTTWVDTIRNYRIKPIRFELRRVWTGDVEYNSEITTSTFDFRTTEVTFDVENRASFRYPATVLTHHGRNSRENRVRIR